MAMPESAREREARERSEREQRRAWLATTLGQRIAWLEQAKRFAARALDAAQREYLRAVITYNEAQFRLQRALGWPMQ
jgi:hypothetical protein